MIRLPARRRRRGSLQGPRARTARVVPARWSQQAEKQRLENRITVQKACKRENAEQVIQRGTKLGTLWTRMAKQQGAFRGAEILPCQLTEESFLFIRSSKWRSVRPITNDLKILSFFLAQYRRVFPLFSRLLY